jgi:hypothetical protein
MISFKEYMSSQRSENPLKEDSILNEEMIKDDHVENLMKEDHHIKEEVVEEKIEVTGYKIYRDKPETFMCDMEISGANPATSKARIIIEGKDLTYMFEGTIDAKGKCKIPLKKMGFLTENEKGIIKLEVIADDTVFTPWEDNFTAVNSKRVAIKVFESQDDNTQKIGVRLKTIG